MTRWKSLKMLAGASAMLLAGVTSVFAEVTVADPASEIKTKGPAIWKVSDEDTSIYMFGTVHILSKDVAWRTEKFDNIWNDADIIYFETDASPQAQTEIQGLVLSHGAIPAGSDKTFSSYFSEEQLELINEETDRLGLPMQNLEPLRPWLVSVTVSVMQIMKAGGDPEAGVDKILSTEAREADRNLRYFETGEEQIRFFADMPDELMAKMLVQGINQMREQPDYFDEMVTAWKTGDVDKLATQLNDAVRETDPMIADVILYNRNARWADTLEKTLGEDEGTILVAVGAGHLVGQKSLQDYLEEKGLEVERIN